MSSPVTHVTDLLALIDLSPATEHDRMAISASLTSGISGLESLNENSDSCRKECNSSHQGKPDIGPHLQCLETSSEFAQSPESSLRLQSPNLSDELYCTWPNSHINRLGDKCLANILDRLPLQQLIKYRCVCLRWFRVIETQICPKRTSVKLFRSVNCLQKSIGSLFDSDVEAKLYCRFECLIISLDTSVLQSNSINPFYRFLTRAIPRMEQITFYFAPANSHDMIHILDKWRRSLTFISFANMSSDLDWKTIWSRVGSLNMLNHLVINNHWCLKNPTVLPQLKHLESLSIFNYHLTKLLPAIDKFESKITRLTLSNTSDSPVNEVSLREWVSRKPELRYELTHLTIDGKLGICESHLKTICAMLCALTHLDVKFDNQLKFDVIINLVSKLKHLEHFTIRSDNEALFTDLDPNNFFTFDRWFHLSSRQSIADEDHLHSFYYPLLQMSSLTALYFFIRVNVFHFSLPTALFPNLAKLLINVPGLKCQHSTIICSSCCHNQLELKLRQKFGFFGQVDLRNKKYVDFLSTIQNG